METLGPFLPTALQVAQKFQSCLQTVKRAQGWKKWWYIILMQYLSPHKEGPINYIQTPSGPWEMCFSIGLPQTLFQTWKMDLVSSQPFCKTIERVVLTHTHLLLSHSCTLLSGASLAWERVSPSPHSQVPTGLLPNHSLYPVVPRQELL